MTIAREDVAWAALGRALSSLVAEVGAVNAVVCDVSENLWCRAIDLDDAELAAVDAMLALAVAAASAPLQRGGSVRLERDAEPPFLCARSFAGIYLLLVWFDARFDAAVVASKVQARLPEIERLTVALPPDDPDRPAESASKGRS